MSNHTMKWAWQQHLPSTEKLVLLALASAINDRETCGPSIATLASQCSVSTRTMQRLIHSLVAKDLIERHLQQRSDGARTSNRYRLQIEESREVPNLRDARVAGVRHVCPGDPDTNVMAPDFHPASVELRRDANPQRVEQTENKRADIPAHAGELAVASAGSATSRAKPLFPELARVIG